jgi:hypothetical protein
MTVSGERARWIRAALLVLLGGTAIAAFMIGISVQSDEFKFRSRRMDFEYGGTPVVGTVLTKTVGRRADFFIVGPQTALFGADRAAARPSQELRVRVSSSTFDKYQVGDRIELFTLGEESMVREEKFEPILTETQSWVVFGFAIAAMFAVKFGWRIEEPGNPLA